MTKTNTKWWIEIYSFDCVQCILIFRWARSFHRKYFSTGTNQQEKKINFFFKSHLSDDSEESYLSVQRRFSRVSSDIFISFNCFRFVLGNPTSPGVVCLSTNRFTIIPSLLLLVVVSLTLTFFLSTVIFELFWVSARRIGPQTLLTLFSHSSFSIFFNFSSLFTEELTKQFVSVPHKPSDILSNKNSPKKHHSYCDEWTTSSTSSSIVRRTPNAFDENRRNKFIWTDRRKQIQTSFMYNVYNREVNDFVSVCFVYGKSEREKFFAYLLNVN